MNGCKVRITDNTIAMGAMQDGQLAVVVSSRFPHYAGLIVHRHGDTISTVGKTEIGCWPLSQRTDARVKPLKAGDQITVS